MKLLKKRKLGNLKIILILKKKLFLLLFSFLITIFSSYEKNISPFFQGRGEKIERRDPYFSPTMKHMELGLFFAQHLIIYMKERKNGKNSNHHHFLVLIDRQTDR